MNTLNGQLSAEDHRMKEPRQGVGILLCTILVFVLLGGIPFLFLLYGAIGAALLGVCILATLIGIQFVLFYPLWNNLNRETCNSRQIDESGCVRDD